MDLSSDGAAKVRDIASGANKKGQVAAPLLGKSEIELSRDGLLWTCLGCVGYDADDFVGILSSFHAHAAADGVFAGEMLFPERMVDDGHPWRTPMVVISEISTAKQLNPGGAEIARRNL